MISSQTLPEPGFELSFDPKRAIHLPLGAASPLWFIYAGAASAGVAYWWLSRWREATNIEALFGQASPVDVVAPVAEVLVAQVAEPIIEAQAIVADVVDEAVERVLDPEPTFVAAAEILAEPVSEVEAAVEAAPEPPPAAARSKPLRGARPVVDDPA